MNNTIRNQNSRKMDLCTNQNNIEVAQVNQDQSPLFSTQYIQGILKEAEGFYVKIEFLIGTQLLVYKEGYITDVGINFVTLFNPEEDIFITCDMYSIKFVNFTSYRDPNYKDEFQKRMNDYNKTV